MTKLTSQAARFVRLFVMAAFPGALLFATGQSKLTIAAATPAVVGALEVAWRSIHPTVSATSPTPPSSSANSGPYTPV